MTYPDLLERYPALADGIRGKLKTNQPMSQISWFRTGGPAQLFFQPADADDLAAFLAKLPEEIAVLPVGLGSNLLIRDGGLAGVVIRLSAKGFGSIERTSETRITVGAAVPDKRLAAAAADFGLGGFAFYNGIPGGIGGALKMNAGAHGTETCERVVELHAIDRQGKKHVLSNADMAYRYRHSSAPEGYIFTHAVFEGIPMAKDDILAEMDEVTAHRERAQPIREKTGGSTFKNPEGTSAWKEVDAAGCRGLTIGGAQMSEMHCNFMINTGEATGHDLELLGETVRKRVFENSGIKLEWEIKRLGAFAEGETIEPFLGVLGEAA